MMRGRRCSYVPSRSTLVAVLRLEWGEKQIPRAFGRPRPSCISYEQWPRAFPSTQIKGFRWCVA